MVGWTREQAIADVVLASDGFGRVYGADLETPAEIQPCVMELARSRVLWQRPTDGLYPFQSRCRRPGCSSIFAKQNNKRYCSFTCAGKENRRRQAERNRRAARELIEEQRRIADHLAKRYKRA